MAEEITRIRKIRNGLDNDLDSDWQRIEIGLINCNLHLHCLIFVCRKIQPEINNQQIDLLAIWMEMKESQENFTEERERIENNFSIGIVRNFVVEFQWNVEYFLKTIHLKLGLTGNRKKYYQYVDNIIEKLEIQDECKTKKGLMELSYVRNKLHGGSNEYIVNESSEDFKWKHISECVDNCITSLEKIHSMTQ